MKKLLLTLSLLLTLGLTAKAETLTETFAVSNSSLQTNEDITISIANPNGGTVPKWYTDYVRVYGTNTITITGADGVTISKVEFKTESSNGTFLNGASATPGTFNASTKTWEGSAQEFVLTNGTVASGHTRINTFIVTYEKAADNRTVVELAWDPAEQTIYFGDEIAPTLSAKVDGVENAEAKDAVVYTSSNTDLLKVAANGTFTLTPNVVGVATVTASIPSDNTTYKATAVEYNLTVLDPNDPYATFVFANYGWNNQREVSTVTEGIVTLTFDQGSNTNAPKYFDNNKDVRLYSGGSLTISVPEGYYITKIESVYKNKNNELTPSSGTFNSDFTTWTKTDNVSSVIFNESGTNGNRSWTSIKVHFVVAPAEIVNIEYGDIKYKATVASVDYVLEVANHKEGNIYTVTLTVTGADGTPITGINEDHTLVADEAPAVMSRAAANTKLSGTVKVSGLSKSTNYTATLSYAVKGEEATPTTVGLPGFTTNATGIEDVTIDGNQAAEYYNLQGVRVAEPQAGQIYIVRRGAKVTKELIK